MRKTIYIYRLSDSGDVAYAFLHDFTVVKVNTDRLKHLVELPSSSRIDL